MVDSIWLSSCSSMLKDKSKLDGVAWRQFIIDTLAIVEAVDVEGLAVDVKFAVCYISTLVISHCDEEDARFPATFLLVEKVSDLIVRHLQHQNAEVKELYCHCLTLLLNLHSFPKFSKQCCTDAVVELFEVCRHILADKLSSEGVSFSGVIKANEKAGIRSAFLVSHLEDSLLKESKTDDMCQGDSMRRMVSSSLHGRSIQKHLADLIISLPILSQLSASVGDNHTLVKKEWPAIVSELKLLTAVVSSPLLGRKGFLHASLLSLLTSISTDLYEQIAARFSAVLDICLVLCRMPAVDAPNFCFVSNHNHLQNVRNCLSSWSMFFSKTIYTMPTPILTEAIYANVAKINNFLDEIIAKNDAPSRHSLFYVLLLDFVKLLDISIEFLSTQAPQEHSPSHFKAVDAVGRSISISFQLFHRFVSEPHTILTDDVFVKDDGEYNASESAHRSSKRAGSQDVYMSDFEASYIDEDGSLDREFASHDLSRGTVSRKPIKSTSQDDPCTAIFNLFALDDQLSVPHDIKPSVKSSSLGLTGLLNAIRFSTSKGFSADFLQWVTEDTERPSLAPNFVRYVALSLGASVAGTLRKLGKEVKESFEKNWKIKDFAAIITSLRKLYERPVTHQRASLLNVAKYMFVALINQSIITVENCKEIFVSPGVNSSEFWLSNVDAFVRRLVFVFAYHLSSADASAMTQFVEGLWTAYLNAVSRLTLQNYAQNAAVLSVSLANDMLIYFYLLPFSEKRTVVSRICSTLTQIVATSAPFDYPQFSLLLAFADLLICRFVYELPENSLKERVVCGPLDDTCNAVHLNSYNSDPNARTACYETLCVDHQIKPPPALDRLGLASFCASGIAGYSEFYSTLLQLTDPGRFGGGVSVDSLAIKISTVWNTWLGLWYLLPVLPPPATQIEQLMAINTLKSANCLSLTSYVLLFSSMTNLLLREKAAYDAWMEDAYGKLSSSAISSPTKQTAVTPTSDSAASLQNLNLNWSNLRSVLTMDNFLAITAVYLKGLALEFKQTYLPFAIDSKIPDSLPSLTQLLTIQLLVSNVSQLLTSSTKDFGESAANEMIKTHAFSNFMKSALEIFEWVLYFVKFSASRALHSDEVNDRCLHLRAYLEEFGVGNSSPDKSSNVFEQLISKAAVRTASATGGRPSGRSYTPLVSSVELKPYILNPYLRHVYLVVDMFYELFNSTAALNNWKTMLANPTGGIAITADILNHGTEPTLASAVYETLPYLQTGNATFKPLPQLLTDAFGDAWSVANGEYTLALSHRLLFAISETSGVSSVVGMSKSLALKQAALKCISRLLPTSKQLAIIWQRTYEHSSGDSFNLGRMLLSCNEATLQPQAVNIVCQILMASTKSEYEQELSCVASTLNSLSNENNVMFLLMSLLSSSNGNHSSLEELLGAFVGASSVIGPKLFLIILDCLLKVCGEALKAGDFLAVSDNIFPAIILTTRALSEGDGHVKTLGLMQHFLEICRKSLVETEGKEDAPITTTATLLAYTCRVLASASKYAPNVLAKPSVDTPATDDLLRALFSPLGSPSTDAKPCPGAGLNSDNADCEDVEEDDDLDSKLCTFTLSQKSFMNQHWYHCHTCSMTDGFGVCSICAKVCHKDHDLAYSKFSSFFCDCGAKEDNSCIAKSRRIGGVLPNAPPPNPIDTSLQQQQQQNVAARFGRLGVLARGRPLPPPPNSQPASQQNQAIDLRQQQQQQSRQQQHQSGSPLVRTADPLTSPLLADSFVINKESSVQAIVNVIKESNLSEEVCSILRILCGFFGSEASQASSSIYLSKKCRADLDRLLTSSLSVQIGSQFFVDQSNIDLTSDFKFDSHRVFETDKTRLKQLVEAGKMRMKLVACNPVGNLGYYAVIQTRNRVDLYGLPHLVQASASITGKAGGVTSKPRKYQPHKLGCLTLPFSLAGVEINRDNDSLLAVYGSSDVEVILLSASSYAPREQLAVQVQLESQQSFIVGCRWLPGSQSILGIVVNDCVKIFDTATDVTTPIYHFLLPSCKIVDMAFAVYGKDEQYALILGSNGHVYVQKLSSDFGAHAGPFYVTSVVLARDQKSLPSAWKNAAETLGDGGLSIAYSHRLQILALTCESGVFLLPGFVPKMDAPTDVFVDNIVSVTPRNDREKWVLNCGDSVELLVPGLFIGSTDSGNVVALFVRPDGVSVSISEQLNHCGVRCCHYFLAGQVGSKQASIFGISHDGKLLRYSLDQSFISHWTAYSSPSLPEIGSLFDYSGKDELEKEKPATEQQPPAVRRTNTVNKDASSLTTTKRSGSTSNTRSSYAAAASAAVVKFPVDFFEHCQPATNVEFGGAQLLHVYNRDQLKLRLSPTNSGLYIASPGAFSLSVANKTVGTLLVGVRFQLGNHRPDKVPQFIRIFDRTIPTNCPQSRWFDCPLTRSETIAARNKLQIYFGSSSSGVTIVDSVQIYVKSREEFGWVEPDIDTPAQATMFPALASSLGSSKTAEDAGDRLYPPVYVTSSVQLVLNSSIGILRRLGEPLPDEKVITLLLQTPSTSAILRAALSWLLSSSASSLSSVRSLVQKAVANVDYKRDVSSYELLLLLNSFLALTTSPNVESTESTKTSSEILRQLVERYHEISLSRPFTWSTTPIHQLELSRILTFAPYLVLLLLEAVSRPQSARMLASLLGSVDIDESFVAQQALELFYYAGSSSPWAVLMASSLNAEPTPTSPTTTIEKFHSE